QRNLSMTDSPDIARIARDTKIIAVVGLSPKAERPSHGVARFLQNAGYRIIPVNPGHAGQQILGQTVHASLSEIPDADSVDMLDIFRQSDAVPAIVDEALTALPYLRPVWMQIGVQSDSAAAKPKAKGLTVVQNRCPKIEFPAVL